MEKKCNTEKHSPDERNEFGMEKLSSEQRTQLMVKKNDLRIGLECQTARTSETNYRGTNG
jgi:hypothetical protein